MPTSSKVLCAVYAAIALVALIATWSQNVAYFDNPGGFLLDFLNDSRVTPASRSLTVDIVLFFLAAAILMVVEARKRGVKLVWLCRDAVERRRHRRTGRAVRRDGGTDNLGRHGLTVRKPRR
jgi:hypothetical protein